MGVYDTITNSGSKSDRINALLMYLNSLDGVTAEEASETYSSTDYDGVSFTLSDSNITGFFGYANDLIHTLIWLKNDDIYLVNPSARGSSTTTGSLTIHSYIDDECKLISIHDSHNDKHGIEFMLVNVNDNKKLIGYLILTGNDTFVDISSLTYEGTDDSLRLACTYANMFPYAANAGTLDFLAQAYFVNNGVRKYTTTSLKECSTVTLLSTVSLPTPLNNHLAIGAHCIVPISS